MSFVVILLVLFLERVLIEQDEWRRGVWLGPYLARLRGLPLGDRLVRGAPGLIIVLTPPLLLVGIVQSWLGEHLGGIPDLIFGALVLIYCLGPSSLDAQVQAFRETLEEDERGVDPLVRAMLGAEPSPGRAALITQVARAIPVQAHRRILAVLFWFLVLGPVGALLYRLARHLDEFVVTRTRLDEDFRTAAQRLPYILDWVPARLTAATYCLAGSFEPGLTAWRHSAAAGASPEQILEHTAAAALDMGDEELPEQDTQILLDRANALVWRAVGLWVALVGLSSLSYWSS
jgi:AmpE protein